MRRLAYDPIRDGVWVGTGGGVTLLTPPTTGVLGVTFLTFRTSGGLPSNNVNHADVAPSGDVYFATSNGVGILDHVTATISAIRQGDGLPTSDARDVAVQVELIGGLSREIAWVATTNGLGRIDLTTSTIAITTTDGLPNGDLRTIAVLPDQSKLVGTNNAGVFKYVGQ